VHNVHALTSIAAPMATPAVPPRPAAGLARRHQVVGVGADVHGMFGTPAVAPGCPSCGSPWSRSLPHVSLFCAADDR